MIEGERCACGWKPTDAQRKQIIETAGFTWSQVFTDHLKDQHALPPHFEWSQFHELIDFLDKKYHI